ncbi:MAG: hypothetical protein MJZ14_07440 [Paludibacteraceae bacterium]|nr:hypothetical protein [Paludibacteraceae bacterium]
MKNKIKISDLLEMVPDFLFSWLTLLLALLGNGAQILAAFLTGKIVPNSAALDLMALLMRRSGHISDVLMQAAYSQIDEHYGWLEVPLTRFVLRRKLRSKKEPKIKYTEAYWKTRNSDLLLLLWGDASPDAQHVDVDYNDRLNMLISLFEVAASDRSISGGEYEVIERYAQEAKIEPTSLSELKKRYEKGYEAGLIRVDPIWDEVSIVNR